MTPRFPTDRRVVVTGLGFITPIGNDRATVETALRTGCSGVERVEFLNNPNLPVKVAGTVKDFAVSTPNWRQWTWPKQYDIPRETLRGLAPHGVYSFCAVTQALAEAGIDDETLRGDERTGLYCASAGSPMLAHHNVEQMHLTKGERGNPLGVISCIAGTLNFNLAAHFGITGTVCGFVSACASSSHALGYACDEIRLGRLDRAIIVGAEEVDAATMVPFSFMHALSGCDDPAQASRPFDTKRDGFVGAGGAMTMIIENEATARARGATIQAELAGWGQSADGYRVMVSHPQGSGLALAINRALSDAGIPAPSVDYVSAHATSTVVGDRAEAVALNTVFEHAPIRPLVSSTKGLTGHPLSMSGAMEAAFCVLALRQGFVPGNCNLETPDPACEGLTLPRTTEPAAVQIALNNSSGFGGSNVCHIFRKVE